MLDVQKRVCVKNVGANAFPLVAAFFWLYTLQPDEKLLVSAARPIRVAPTSMSGATVTTRRTPSELPHREDDLDYLQI
ncbi:MAG: hypothetical protein ACRDOH_35430 [Streptosporangiaceae bacterium]